MKVFFILSVFNLELFGRLAAVGYADVGIG
jgi:hypothetical protein